METAEVPNPATAAKRRSALAAFGNEKRRR